MRHFKLRTDLKKEFLGIKLYRIELTIDCKWGKKGDLGGYVEKESNLQDNACVYGNALVYGNARVYGDALVYGDAQVYGNALVYGNARVYGDALVYGNAQVSGNACVYGNARVYGNAQVSGNACVYGDALVYGDAQVYGDAKIEKYGQCVVINNQKNNITLTPNLIIIGCKTWKTLEEFNNTCAEIGRQNNYTADEIIMTKEIVNSIMSRMTPIKQTVEITLNGQKFEIDLEKAKELGIIK